jgi:hypothetical protein
VLEIHELSDRVVPLVRRPLPLRGRDAK